MIHNINAINSYGVSISAGEYDTIKHRLRLYFAKSRVRKQGEIEVYDVNVPEDATIVELMDLDTDSLYSAEIDVYDDADRNSGKVFLRLDDFTKTR